MNVSARHRVYRPPIENEPIDEIQLALVRALAPIIIEKIREELAAEDAAPGKNTQPHARIDGIERVARTRHATS